MIETTLLISIGFISGYALGLCVLAILIEIKDAAIDSFDKGEDIGVCKC